VVVPGGPGLPAARHDPLVGVEPDLGWTGRNRPSSSVSTGEVVESIRRPGRVDREHGVVEPLGCLPAAFTSTPSPRVMPSTGTAANLAAEPSQDGPDVAPASRPGW